MKITLDDALKSLAIVRITLHHSAGEFEHEAFLGAFRFLEEVEKEILYRKKKTELTKTNEQEDVSDLLNPISLC